MTELKGDEYYMKLALAEAKAAAGAGEIPVGAVIVSGDGEILSHAHNRVEVGRNALLHAEMVAMGMALAKRKEKYLADCTIYITLEPCAMCAAAIALAKIGRVVWSALDEKGGAVSSGVRLWESSKNLFTPKQNRYIIEECGEILTKFFKERRCQAKNQPEGSVKNRKRLVAKP